MSDIRDHLYARVKKQPEGCWLWLGPTNAKGYGRMMVGKKSVRVHRLSYELAHGPIPEGLSIDHVCRTRNCVNPDHLRAVTNRENVLCGEGVTAQNARKTHCKHGHPLSGDNLGVLTNGGRRCRQCHRNSSKRLKASRVVFGPSGSDTDEGNRIAPSVGSQLQPDASRPPLDASGTPSPVRPPSPHRERPGGSFPPVSATGETL